MLAAVFVLALLLSNDTVRDKLRGCNKKERTAICTSKAFSNIRITNEYNGVVYKPLSVLFLKENQFAVEVESIERPHRITTIYAAASQFKHDVIKTLEDGVINYRVVKPELINPNYGIDNDVPAMIKEKVYDESSDPKYTDKELKILSEVDMDERTILEGELLNLKASKTDDINKIIDSTVKLSSSKNYGGPK
jgi:hypothetical protein